MAELLAEQTTTFDIGDASFTSDTGSARSLLGNPADEALLEPEPDESGEVIDTEGDGEAGEETPPPVVDTTLTALAEKFGVDINNPNLPPEVVDILRKVAEQGQSARSDEAAQPAKPVAKEINWGEGIEELASDEPPLEKPAKAETAAEGQTPIDDIGAGWKSPVDAITAENDALTEGDFEKTAKIREAVIVRYAQGMIMPTVQQMVQQALSEFSSRYGLNDAIQASHMADDRTFALKAAKADEELAPMVEELFKVRGDKPLVHKGQEFANTLYNEMLTKFPELLNIRVEDPNPRVAQRKTFAKRYTAAARLHAQMTKSAPAKAEALVSAVRKGEHRRQTTERIRQSLNAGSSASGVGQPPSRDYAEDLNDLPDFGSARRLLGR